MRLHKSKAISISDAIKNLDFAALGPGYRRGLVLCTWTSKVCEVAGTKEWYTEFDRVWLTGQSAASDSPAYCKPELVIKMKPGSMWRHELHMQRYAIKQAVNERFDEEFVRSVRMK